MDGYALFYMIMPSIIENPIFCRVFCILFLRGKKGNYIVMHRGVPLLEFHSTPQDFLKIWCTSKIISDEFSLLKLINIYSYLFMKADI